MSAAFLSLFRSTDGECSRQRLFTTRLLLGFLRSVGCSERLKTELRSVNKDLSEETSGLGLSTPLNRLRRCDSQETVPLHVWVTEPTFFHISNSRRAVNPAEYFPKRYSGLVSHVFGVNTNIITGFESRALGARKHGQVQGRIVP